MSGKLGQSLDEIIKTRRTAKPTRGAARPTRAAARKPAASAAGITKSTRGVKGNPRVAAPVAPTPSTSKILVTGLPYDVTEQQIKEYFQATIAPVKQVVVTYGANGASRGIAAITFVRPESAASAAKQLDGTKVDGKPMKIEVIVSAKNIPAAKGLGDRIAQVKAVANGKSKPKSAVPVKAAAAAKGARAAPAKRGGRSGRAGRAKPKTADELDAEMTDYFVPKEASGAAAATTGAAANGGDASMDDQIM